MAINFNLRIKVYNLFLFLLNFPMLTTRTIGLYAI